MTWLYFEDKLIDIFIDSLIYLLTRWYTYWLADHLTDCPAVMECLEIHWLLTCSCMMDGTVDGLSKQVRTDGWPHWRTRWFVSLFPWLYNLMNGWTDWIVGVNEWASEWVTRVTEQMNVWSNGRRDCYIHWCVEWQNDRLTELNERITMIWLTK